MATRKCIYTGKDALFTDSIIPRDIMGSEEIHNWDNKAPMSKDYKEIKEEGLMPTEIEIEANDTFHKLELAKIKVRFYEDKLVEIQKQIAEGKSKLEEPKPWYRDPPKVVKKRKKQEKEYKIALHEVEEIQEAEKNIEKRLAKKLKKSNMWG